MPWGRNSGNSDENSPPRPSLWLRFQNAVVERRAVVVEDIKSDPDSAPDAALAREAGYCAVTSIPLLTLQGEVIGSLATFFAEPHRPSERQARLVEFYARLAGQCLDNAQRLPVRTEALKNAVVGADDREIESDRGLPLTDPPPAVPTRNGAAVASPPAAAPAPPPGRCALVVDDEDNAKSMARLLRIWGYAVRVALAGPEALAAAREARPDVVLLDIGLPGQSGHDVARALRHEFPGPMLILAVTGYSYPEDLNSAGASGFDRYLVKPIDLDILRECLARAGSIETIRA